MLISFSNLKRKYNMNITGIIHVGGHYGEELQEYVQNGVQSIVVFEPLERNFNVLFKNVEGLNADIQGYQVALGSTEGNCEMYVSSNGALSSSLLKPKKHLEQYRDITFNEKETVEVATLDSFNLQGFNFINMDVQGFELEVLKGGKQTLDQVDYVYTEVNRDEVYEDNVYIEELDVFLSDFSRVETEWTGETWGDALYIRKRIL
jgi:FkbM family methyltransferase